MTRRAANRRREESNESIQLGRETPGHAEGFSGGDGLTVVRFDACEMISRIEEDPTKTNYDSSSIVKAEATLVTNGKGRSEEAWARKRVARMRSKEA